MSEYTLEQQKEAARQLALKAARSPAVTAAVKRAMENVRRMAVEVEPPVPPPRGSVWEHYKGTWYQVLYVARHSETQEPMVVYRPFKDPDGDVWVRPLSMWHETVYDGRRRFSLILG